MDSIMETAQGGKSSEIYGMPSLMPPQALKRMARVFKEGGRKYGLDNWHSIPVRSDAKDQGHLDHALMHIYNYLEVEDIEELEHAAVRVMMALELSVKDDNENM